jgi:aminoglycoside 3-N-acetyltransferase I
MNAIKGKVEEHVGVKVRRLGAGDVELGRETLRLMAAVFEEPFEVLSAGYVASLLARPDFWLLAALRDGVPIGGVTAHALPMTRSESTELFIYDLAVSAAEQRRGVGRALVGALRSQAAEVGIHVTFVPADNDDTHALDFYRAIGGEAAPVTIFTWE